MLFPIPKNESARLESLRSYQILDTESENVFDDLALLAAQICQAPIALISFVDSERQWIKSCVGVDVTETPREVSFCTHAIMQENLFIIPDATKDERFADNPLVKGPPFIRFYAGAPLIGKDGHALGAICVVSHFPRELSIGQKEAMLGLSRLVVSQLTLRQILKYPLKRFMFAGSNKQ